MTQAAVGKYEAKGHLERPVASRMLGIWLLLVLSVLIITLYSPLVSWLSLNGGTEQAIVDLQELTKFKKKEAAFLQESIKADYHWYDFLAFVHCSKMGVLGFPAAILLVATVAAALFQVVTLIGAIIGKPGSRGWLGFYGKAKTAMLLTFITSVCSVAFYFFANASLKQGFFVLNPLTYVLIPLSLAGYIIVKIMEKVERVRWHDHGLLEELRRNWVLFIFLIPCAVYFIINNYLPMSGVYFAFTKFNFTDGLFASPFVAFDNFTFLFKSELLKLTKNTILYNVVFIILGNVLQIFFAILVSQVGVKWFKKTSQTLIFMPYFVSYVILRVLVYNMFEYDVGLINTYVTAFGGERIDFYNTPAYWPFLITAFDMWKGLGYGMVVYLATIMGISDEYYEAAKVDGANIFQQIIYITVPLLKPTFIILLLYSLGGIMRGQFELFYQMVGNNGVLYNVTDILDTYVYRVTTTQPLSMGLATAAGLYQSVFGLIIIVVTNALIKRGNPEYALF